MKILRLTRVDGEEILLNTKYFHSACVQTVCERSGFSKYTTVYMRSHRDEWYSVKESLDQIMAQLASLPDA